MLKRIAIIATITLALLTAATQAGEQHTPSVHTPLYLNLERDSRPTWDQAVGTFSDALIEAFRLEQSQAQRFSSWILDASDRHSIPPDLMAALINTESNFRIKVRSWAAAVGPAQVIPRVWQKTCEQDLSNPAHNIQCGALVLRHYYTRYCKAQSWQCALEYYHTGPGKMALGDAYKQTRRAYVSKVNRNLGRLGNANGYGLRS